ncbi:YitT family protein [Gemella sp. GH3]|uniref:YitT family protein n=1 Tax=unclassified Gemella TaxID=2624949 RepID=UPI0015D0CEFA|nr:MULTISPECIES: YitT family protein [unclassified Gemella]MBF0714090.1 YitT family protein [Gemella sp. GH3.1]NYS51042.1 YitT family protein [Gemella sp. GH3]
MIRETIYEVNKRKHIKNILFMIIGIFIFSIYAGVLIPYNNLSTGGALGIALVLNKTIGIKLGLAQLLLNIPLFYIGFKYVSKKFMVITVIFIVASSFLIDYLPTLITPINLQDKLVATIFAGILSGVAMCLILISGGSTGGTDITGKFLVKKYNLNLPTVFLIQDIVIYTIIWISFDLRYVMYAVIMSFVRNQTMRTFQKFISAYIQCTIISDNADSLAEIINREMNRGCTIIDVEGSYTHQKRKMLILVIQQNELYALKKLINKNCPKAFITVNSINTIMGNFKEHSYIL